MRHNKQMAEGYEAFEKLWKEVEKKKALPYTALLNVPEALSRDTKNQLSKLNYEDAVRIMSRAIREIDEGSVKTLDSEVRRIMMGD